MRAAIAAQDDDSYDYYLMKVTSNGLVTLTLSFPGSPAGLPGPHTKSSRRSSCYNREVGVWVRLKAISVVLSLILASLGRFPRNFLPFSDSYTFLVYHQDI